MRAQVVLEDAHEMPRVCVVAEVGLPGADESIDDVVALLAVERRVSVLLVDEAWRAARSVMDRVVEGVGSC